MTNYFDTRRLWCRIYETRILTDDGVFAEGQLPADFGGSEFEIQYSQIMVFSDGTGPFMELVFKDFNGVQDSGRKTGIGFQYVIFGKQVTFAPKGPSAHIAQGTVEFLTDNFTQVEHEKLLFQYRKHLIRKAVITDD